MATSEPPEKPEDVPRLTARQREVLRQVVEGQPVVPEEGRRVGLTLNSLVNRGLIEPSGAEEAVAFRATAEAKDLVDLPAQAVGSPPEPAPPAPHPAKEAAHGAGGVRATPGRKRAARRVEEEDEEEEEEAFVPRVGQRVWNLDFRGRRKPAIYRVDRVDGEFARLSEWFGPSFRPVAQPQKLSSLVPLTDEELAAAIRNGMPRG